MLRRRHADLLKLSSAQCRQVNVTLRRDQPVNLCGAFEKPIRAGEDGYAAESERRFVEYAKKVYSSYASEPVAAYAIGDEIAELGKVMPLNTLLNAVYEDIKAYLSESEGV